VTADSDLGTEEFIRRLIAAQSTEFARSGPQFLHLCSKEDSCFFAAEGLSPPPLDSPGLHELVHLDPVVVDYGQAVGILDPWEV
jgi:hypothetical protein